jgi:hypothetical protein
MLIGGMSSEKFNPKLEKFPSVVTASTDKPYIGQPLSFAHFG